ncbi:hypothetical protein GCM10022224_042250 [Nonomuraea antimicrobica]|uniref:Secreted protein n=1 Tax=Nonomuraea antimicrobica TaxID=561173 RepID=A0ABP7C0S0_9ACTN
MALLFQFTLAVTLQPWPLLLTLLVPAQAGVASRASVTAALPARARVVRKGFTEGPPWVGVGVQVEPLRLY